LAISVDEERAALQSLVRSYLASPVAGTLSGGFKAALG